MSLASLSFGVERSASTHGCANAHGDHGDRLLAPGFESQGPHLSAVALIAEPTKAETPRVVPQGLGSSSTGGQFR